MGIIGSGSWLLNVFLSLCLISEWSFHCWIVILFIYLRSFDQSDIFITVLIYQLPQFSPFLLHVNALLHVKGRLVRRQVQEALTKTYLMKFFEVSLARNRLLQMSDLWWSASTSGSMNASHLLITHYMLYNLYQKKYFS